MYEYLCHSAKTPSTKIVHAPHDDIVAYSAVDDIYLPILSAIRTAYEENENRMAKKFKTNRDARERNRANPELLDRASSLSLSSFRHFPKYTQESSNSKFQSTPIPCAINIARKLLIETASSRVNSSHIHYQTHITVIGNGNRIWDEKRPSTWP